MKTNSYTQSGSALVYILVAIALLAALTASFMGNSSQQTSSQNAFNSISELKNQIAFIRSSIQECVLNYPGGDSVAIGAGAQENNPYPIQPNEPFYDNEAVTPGTSHYSYVKEMRCPGNPGDDPDHELMFLGTSGKFMPPPPTYFNDWYYYNGAGGVFFFTYTTFSDGFLDNVLSRIEGAYSECEVDIIDATGGAVNLTTEATFERNLECAEGQRCIRIWMVRDGANDVPDKAACN